MSKSVEDLRREFDERFAERYPEPAEAAEDAVAISAGGRSWVIRVVDLQRIEAVGKVVPLPGAPPHLQGVAGVQGRLVAVYSLAGLLGLDDAGPSDGWIAICRDEETLGLRFEKVEGYLRLTSTEMDAAQSPEAPRPLIDVTALRGLVRRLASPSVGQAS